MDDDPYAVLGVAPDVSDLELRRIYRAQAKRHHPDHNGGSPEAAARFAQIQDAYAAIAERRRHPQPDAAPEVEDRIARLEREMAAMRAAEQRRAAEQARLRREQAAPQARRLHATPEELGYYTTDDSFTKIIDDAADQLAGRLRKSDAKRQFARRLSDIFGRED